LIAPPALTRRAREQVNSGTGLASTEQFLGLRCREPTPEPARRAEKGSYRAEFKLLSLGAFYRVSFNLPAAISVYVADTID
jgi:hypothetical protein